MVRVVYGLMSVRMTTERELGMGVCFWDDEGGGRRMQLRVVSFIMILIIG